MNTAETYLEMALWAIKLAQSPSYLRHWWAEEGTNRKLYGLTQEQIDTIADACREHIREMGELVKERPQPQQRRAAR